MKIGLIEDNVQAVELMQSMIREHFPDLEYVGAAATLKEGQDLIRKNSPDILLVDIQLRDCSSFELLESLSSCDLEGASLIFITAHGTMENVYKALRMSAIDYLIKPIDEKHFIAAIEEAMESGESLNGSKVEQFLTMVQKGVQNLQLPKMPVYLSKGVIEFISWDDMIYIKGEENISYFFLTGGRRLVSTKNIGFYYQAVEENGLFFQISKSKIINLKHLERYQHSQQLVELAEGHNVAASRRGGSRLLQYLKGNND